MKKQSDDIFEPAVPVVPEGWDVLPFEQAVDVISDKSKRVKQSAYLPSGKLPVIDQGQEFIGGYTDNEALAFEGELPVILFGDHTRSIKYVDKPFAVGAEGVKILKPTGGFDPKYLYYLLRSLHIPSRGYSRHFQFLRKFHFPRAPENQQKRIVAEIEKQFSLLDQAVANLKRVKANLKRYKAAVLKAAVEGRLVETEAERARREGRSYETGAQLLQRILETRRRQWQGKGKYKEPAAPDTTDLPELPEGWVWASLDQACAKITDGTHHSPKNYPHGEYKYITSKNVREFRLALEDITYVDKATHDEIYARCDVRKDDVLYVKDGVNTGLSAKNTLDEPFSLLSSVGVFRALSLLSPDYLVAYLNSTVVRDRMLANIAGVAITRLTLNKLKVTAIAIPPISEQGRIVAEVDRRLSILRETEAQVDANLQRAECLRQAILARAFSGRLTTAAPGSASSATGS